VHSLGWISARDAAALVGFVNVAWDGGVHAFVLDTMVAADARRQARAAKCEWLHVDFEDDLRAVYFNACGFTPTKAGLRRASYSGQTWRLYSSGARSTAAAHPGASRRPRR